MREIVVDKSFIDGSPASTVRELCASHSVLMTEELFFELITTGAEKRRRAFSKFPNVTDPVTLIPNIGSLLRFEREFGMPSAPNLHRHRIEVSFEFNSRLRDGTFVFGSQYADELRSFNEEVEASTRDFIDRCVVVHEFFPELTGIKVSDFPRILTAARHSIATDLDRVRQVYHLLTSSYPDAQSPRSESIDPNWAWFRWVQVQLIAALRIFVRYQGKVPTNVGGRFWTVAEHTMLDSYYVLFGALCGALASRDFEIQEDFTLLQPDGFLLR